MSGLFYNVLCYVFMYVYTQVTILYTIYIYFRLLIQCAFQIKNEEVEESEESVSEEVESQKVHITNIHLIVQSHYKNACFHIHDTYT